MQRRSGRDEQWRRMLFDAASAFAVPASRAEVTLVRAVQAVAKADFSTESLERLREAAAEAREHCNQAQVEWAPMMIAFSDAAEVSRAAESLLDELSEAMDLIEAGGNENLVSGLGKLLASDRSSKRFIAGANAAIRQPWSRKHELGKGWEEIYREELGEELAEAARQVEQGKAAPPA